MHEERDHGVAMCTLQEEEVNHFVEKEEAVPGLCSDSEEESTFTGIRLKHRLQALEEEVGSLSLEPIEPPVMSVAAQTTHNRWRKATATVDSGSADHVVQEEEFTSTHLEESEGSTKGRRYIAAKG
jgi:hypothetical protein